MIAAPTVIVIARLPIYGRSGVIAYATIDADMLDALSRYRWHLHKSGYAMANSSGRRRGRTRLTLHPPGHQAGAGSRHRPRQPRPARQPARESAPVHRRAESVEQRREPRPGPASRRHETPREIQGDADSSGRANLPRPLRDGGRGCRCAARRGGPPSRRLRSGGCAMTIVIPREIRSCNAWMYQHFRAYMNERDAWLLLLRVQLVPRRVAETRPVRMKITSLRGRLLDFGNYVAGCKPIPDCLKRLGYIRDDAPAWFHCEYVQHVAPKALRCTRIEWEAA